jgi:hypothetical protein
MGNLLLLPAPAAGFMRQCPCYLHLPLDLRATLKLISLNFP